MADSYVCSKAKIKCTCGDRISMLTVLPDRTVWLTGEPQANISDHVPMRNIAPFGKCHTTAYPATGAATAAAHGKLTPMPCVPNTPFPWMGGKNDLLLKGEPALLKSSTCKCIYGGTISFTFDGQTPGNQTLVATQPRDNASSGITGADPCASKSPTPGKTDAAEPPLEEKGQKQTDRIDLYVKIIFSILPAVDKNADPDGADQFFKYADNMELREVKNQMPPDAVLLESNHITVIVNCEDLLATESGLCEDAPGLYVKTMEAVDLVLDFLYSKSDVELANVHFALYAFDFCCDLAAGFARLADEDESLDTDLEEYAGYILETGFCFEAFKERQWFFYVDYVGIFDYYQMYQPKPLESDKEVHTGDMRPQNSQNYQSQPQGTSTDLSPNAYDEELPDADEAYDTQCVLTAQIEYEYNITQPSTRDWLSGVQTVLEIAGVIPGLSETASLVNGFIYLGRMTKACYEWDDELTKRYQREAIISFAGAIPGASIVKGMIKVVRAEKAIKATINAEKVLSQSRLSQRRAQKALSRIKKKKTSHSKTRLAKKRNTQASLQVKADKRNLQKALETRDQRIRETGLTVGELNKLGKGFLADPKKYYLAAMKSADNVILGKVPSTEMDQIVDMIFDLPEHVDALWNGMKKMQEGDYLGAAREFAKPHRSLAIDDVNSHDSMSTINDLSAKLEEINDRYSSDTDR